MRRLRHSAPPDADTRGVSSSLVGWCRLTRCQRSLGPVRRVQRMRGLESRVSRLGLPTAYVVRGLRPRAGGRIGARWKNAPGQTKPGLNENSRLCGKFWWPRAELNRRHADFQSAALPTELPGRGRVLDEGEVPSVKDRTASHLSPSPALASWSHARAGPRFAALSLSGAGAGSRNGEPRDGAGAGSREPRDGAGAGAGSRVTGAGAGGRVTGAAPRKRGLPPARQSACLGCISRARVSSAGSSEAIRPSSRSAATPG